MDAIISGHTIRGEMIVPGSKSHTIRALVIATLAGGRSVIDNPLQSDDCLSAMSAAKLFGSKFTVEDGRWILDGPKDGITVPDNVVDVGNSGTTLYFMASMASLLSGWTVFTGDESIRRRPAKPLLSALGQLGAVATTTRPNSRSAPFMIRGPIKGGPVMVEGNPSQYISSLMLAAPMCEGTMVIKTDNPMETPYIEMTIDWMRRTGIELSYDENSYRYYEIPGNQRYQPFNRVIPSDWSSVAFPLAAGLREGSRLIINNLDFDDKQGDAVIVEHLVKMGAGVTRDLKSKRLVIEGTGKLKGINADMSDTPDAVPIMSLLGSIAEGTTTLTNVSGARQKETDRVAVMEEMLKRMGVDIQTDHNTIVIRGGKGLKGAVVDSYGDHRIAMTLTVAGLFASGTTRVNGAECASVTFPGFYEKLNELGANISLE